MKFNTKQILAIAALALTLACSDTKPQASAVSTAQTPIAAETKESKVAPTKLEAAVKPAVEEPAKPAVEEPAKPIVPAKPEVVSTKPTLDIPEGVNCDAAFSKNELEEALAKGEAYVASESHYAVNPEVDHAFEISLAYDNGKFLVTMNIVHEKKLCLKGASEEASLIIRFEDDETYFYRAKGLHKRNCGTAKKVSDKNAALAVYEIPVNSLLFKKALTSRIKFFGIQATKGVLIGNFLKEDGETKFRNGFRCAYNALGDQFDLSNDRKLIDNSFELEKD